MHLICILTLNVHMYVYMYIYMWSMVTVLELLHVARISSSAVRLCAAGNTYIIMLHHSVLCKPAHAVFNSFKSLFCGWSHFSIHPILLYFPHTLRFSQPPHKFRQADHRAGVSQIQSSSSFLSYYIALEQCLQRSLYNVSSCSQRT